MTSAEKVAEWVRCYHYQHTDLARWLTLVHLKQLRDQGDKEAGKALNKCVEEWLQKA